jgi:hypothetical protein
VSLKCLTAVTLPSNCSPSILCCSRTISFLLHYRRCPSVRLPTNFAMLQSPISVSAKQAVTPNAAVSVKIFPALLSALKGLVIPVAITLLPLHLLKIHQVSLVHLPHLGMLSSYSPDQ